MQRCFVPDTFGSLVPRFFYTFGYVPFWLHVLNTVPLLYSSASPSPTASPTPRRLPRIPPTTMLPHYHTPWHTHPLPATFTHHTAHTSLPHLLPTTPSTCCLLPLPLSAHHTFFHYASCTTHIFGFGLRCGSVTIVGYSVVGTEGHTLQCARQ